MIVIEKDCAVAIFGAEKIEIMEFKGIKDGEEFKYAGVVLRELDKPDTVIKLIFQDIKDVVALMQVLVKVGKSFPEPLIIPGISELNN
jgi:hypothetical protein